MWSVPPPSLDQAKDMYDFDAGELGYTGTDDQAWWDSLVNGSEGKVVHVLSTVADGTHPSFAEWMTTAFAKSSNIKITADHLQRAFHYARLIKTDQEISYIREACRITSGAHEVVMRELGKFASSRQEKASAGAGRRDGKEGLSEWEIESEGDAEAVFVAACRRAGYVCWGINGRRRTDELMQCRPSVLANRRIRKPREHVALRLQRQNLPYIQTPGRFHADIHLFSVPNQRPGTRMLR